MVANSVADLYDKNPSSDDPFYDAREYFRVKTFQTFAAWASERYINAIKMLKKR